MFLQHRIRIEERILKFSELLLDIRCWCWCCCCWWCRWWWRWFAYWKSVLYTNSKLVFTFYTHRINECSSSAFLFHIFHHINVYPMCFHLIFCITSFVSVWCVASVPFLNFKVKNLTTSSDLMKFPSKGEKKRSLSSNVNTGC